MHQNVGAHDKHMFLLVLVGCFVSPLKFLLDLRRVFTFSFDVVLNHLKIKLVPKSTESENNAVEKSDQDEKPKVIRVLDQKPLYSRICNLRNQFEPLTRLVPVQIACPPESDAEKCHKSQDNEVILEDKLAPEQVNGFETVPEESKGDQELLQPVNKGVREVYLVQGVVVVGVNH